MIILIISQQITDSKQKPSNAPVDWIYCMQPTSQHVGVHHSEWSNAINRHSKHTVVHIGAQNYVYCCAHSSTKNSLS